MGNAERILSAATRTFAQRGFDGTTLQAISDDVGVAKQTLLYHYPSKENLRRAVLDTLFGHWRERLPAILQAVTSGLDRFEGLTSEMVRFFVDQPDWARLVIREMLDNPDETRDLLAENLRPWILLIAQYIRDGQKSGIIYEDVHPEAYVMEVIVLAIGTVATRDVLTSSVRSTLSPNTDASPFTEELTRMTRVALFKPRTNAARGDSSSPRDPQK
jgi:TetR/AcrR family transcriptional regulator